MDVPLLAILQILWQTYQNPFRGIRKRINEGPHTITVLFLADIIHQADISFLEHSCVPELEERCDLTRNGAFGIIGATSKDVGVIF